MVPEHKGDEPGGYGTSPHMKTVALSILIMGLSIAAVIVLWIWFGYVGPSFSSNRLLDQQAELRQQYGLPPQAAVPKALLETPPSLRNPFTAIGNASKVTSQSTSTAAGNVTSSGTAPTSSPANASYQTTSTSAGGIQVSIVEGGSRPPTLLSQTTENRGWCYSDMDQ